MHNSTFVDYYESLQVSPKADRETIERVFRLLAKRYHPDNGDTGNIEKFNLLVEAYRVLSDPERRAAYDAKYDEGAMRQWRTFLEAPPSETTTRDKRMRQAILSALYTVRRNNPSRSGVGILFLEHMLGSSEQDMSFQIWYMKEKGWIQRTETGEYAITVSGVDTVESDEPLLRNLILLPPVG